ncbi:serine/threonine-protein kinase [Streptomyces sp. NPDC059629]|uniref:serine/threonine-protein kinase n=1 Tax=Streptomyces sp. NPDC059629 TaxID=3346889 RepID=UPI0036D1F739
MSGSYGQGDGTGRLLAGRYRVTARLGRGGMGVVWRAVDEVLGREVAVKELRAYTDSAGPELADLRMRMQREARAAARVRHPGVIVVHDIAEVEGRPLIVMELVDGPSLDDVLRERGTLVPREAARVGAEVMEALAAAHRVGVLHRDVKPGNVLLDRSGRVVLTDFGIATMDDPGDGSATHLTHSGELVGSLDYLAPERARGADPGPASDIWALGAALYAAVEGASPFRRTSTFSTLTAIIDEPLPEPRRAGSLAPVLRRLMDKRPDSRPGAEEACELLRAVAREPVADVPTTTLRKRAGAAPDPGVPGVVVPGSGPAQGFAEGPGREAFAEESAEQLAEQFAEEPLNGPVEGHVEGPAEVSGEGPAEGPLRRPAEALAEGAPQRAGEVLAEAAAARGAGQLPPARESVDGSGRALAEQPAEACSEVPLRRPAEALAEGSLRRSGEVLAEAAAAQEAVRAVPDRESVEEAGRPFAEGPVDRRGEVPAQGHAEVPVERSPSGVGQVSAQVAEAQGAGPVFGPAPAHGLGTEPGPGDPAGPPRVTQARPRRVGRRAGRLAAVAVGVVLATIGLTVALLNDKGHPAKPDAAPAPSTPADVSASARGTGAGQSAEANAVGQGEETSTAPTGDPTSPEAGGPRASSSASAPGRASSPSPSTVSGTPTATATPTATPAPVCLSTGAGTYTCQVQSAAKSYTADGTKAGKVHPGAHDFYCQVDAGRRATHGTRTNVWWARTDDDNGNTGVYISDVYIEGGDNDEPVPGLPVC